MVSCDSSVPKIPIPERIRPDSPTRDIGVLARLIYTWRKRG